MLPLAFLMIGGGVLSIYTGVTGQHFVPALRAVLTGQSPAGAQGMSPTGGASSGTGGAGHDMNVGGTQQPGSQVSSPRTQAGGTGTTHLTFGDAPRTPAPRTQPIVPAPVVAPPPAPTTAKPVQKQPTSVGDYLTGLTK